MNEAEKIVAVAWEVLEIKKEYIQIVVDELWEEKYKKLYMFNALIKTDRLLKFT